MIPFALTVIGVSSVFLFLYGVNLLYLSWRALRLPEVRSPAGPAPAGTVVVQLPIYNERYVASRVIDAVCRLDWPRERLEVQVLDDSTDDTPEIVAAEVARWRAAGVEISHVHRSSRAGYKAGALAHGLELTGASFVAVFDADFVPPRDFLRRMLPALRDPGVGFVQARWGHLNDEFSLLTYLQSLMTDFHFLVEQAVRPRCGYLTNFTGSAGVWRREAIDDAGGWSASTLTEDLDLSYRAQLRGWRAVYLEDVVVPQELPVSANAYRSQQSRWATGSFQTARRLLGPVLRSDLSRAAKFEGAMHLLGYAAPVAMVGQLACYPLIVIAHATGQHVPAVAIPAVASALSLAPAAGMAVAQWRRGRVWWAHWYGLLGWSVLGAGTSLTVVLAIWRAARGGGEFSRTPKYRIERLGEDWRSKAYFKPAEPAVAAELVLGALGALLAIEAVHYGQGLVAVYAGLFALGFVYLSTVSLVQSLRQVRYEVVAVRVRAVLPRLQGPALLGALAAVLLVVAQVLPDPFEDSYQHWLIAANLATTGRLQDPLFEMQDTWLPAYQVLGAVLLRVFGTWQLGVLRAANVLLAVATLAITYRLAGSRRRGLAATAMLALNPIFILTATSAVAEPLLVLFLMAAAAAAQAKRFGLATVFACLACLTGTKAWLWLGCVLLVLGAEWALRLRARLGSARTVHRRLAWVAPALALALVLEAGFGFASHSVARAAVEVGSATARGSLTASPLVRGGQFLGYFALASLPVVALVPTGLWTALRGRSAADRPVVTVALPSLLYLAAVTGLVVLGVYTGSHRYYYPALPGLALAAAAAVDRLRAPYALLPGAASVAVAVAFIPVLNGLAADNRGLRAAGDSAAILPGALLTDSPAAAYWSHKPPAEIYGSRALPADRAAAVGWMQARDVGGVVLEDIDYYRAYRVLPDLVSGHAEPPFVAVGDESRYTVPGGKTVTVYDVGRLRSQPLFGDVAVGLDLGRTPRQGKTAPLTKGLLIERGGADLTGEGMGVGVPIARYADGWHYPGTATVADLSTPGQTTWRKTFDLDMVGGDNAHGYRFQPAPSVGRVEVTYRVSSRTGVVHIEVRSLGLAPGLLQLAVLNEQSAAFDDYADASGTRAGPAFGNWETVSGPWARLRAGALGVEWAQTAAGSSQFEAGRELSPPDFDWSGLDYLFGPGFTSVAYDVSIRAAR
ncbi:MAG TPA: glycosyltransferase [Candidatus Dormibacteraeota bacterium]|nr:glycosyltransferase [Candidatus Dormibacteraeota bacterium]